MKDRTCKLCDDTCTHDLDPYDFISHENGECDYFYIRFKNSNGKDVVVCKTCINNGAEEIYGSRFTDIVYEEENRRRYEEGRYDGRWD